MNTKPRGRFLFLLVAVSLTHAANAQTFDLILPGTSTRSVARFADDRLYVEDQRGKTSAYDRDPRYDASGYAGYSSTSPAQVIRWPLSGTGSMQVGRVSRGIVTSIQPTRMQISPRGNARPNERETRIDGSRESSTESMRMEP